MSNFDDYHSDLAAWEQKPVIPLIATWNPNDVQHIAKEFGTAFQACSFATTFLPVPPGITNQSIGNKIAEFVTTQMNRRLRGFRIEDCLGAGYSDKQLRDVSDGRLFVCEIKATSHFNPGDSNRIVLTSSSEKLRRKFKPLLHHLLMTACYVDHGGQLEVQKIRLDLFEPTTPVNVRFEASVSQRLLAQAAHRNFML
ncbi:MAG: hypothetical protein ABSG59_19640 [Verrucomicrobiota bacterium]|jgi:hypothetical protein